MFVLDGKRLDPHTSFEGADGQTYLGGWLANASAEELTAAGVLIMDEPQRPDDKFYIVTQNEDGTYSTSPRDLTSAIADLRKARINMAFEEMVRRLSEAVVEVEVGGVVRRYGCDDTTRQNTSDINAAIAAKPSAISEPYYFFPKGEVTPVAHSHADFANIFVAGLAKGSEFFGVYFGHKAAIKSINLADPISTYKAIEAHDFTTGYEELL